MLVNALYFFGKWKNQFESSQTYDEDFHVSKSKIVKVPMMHQTKTMRYADIPQLDAKAVELCYTVSLLHLFKFVTLLVTFQWN